jgi:hypothetical protein
VRQELTINPFDKYNNQADVVQLDKWLAQQQSLNGKQKANTSTKVASKGNFFTHLIPTIGGTAGAAGGAALGTAILPGVGTLAGALLGGALGGGASKVGENAVEHQALGNGVAGQAVEQGVLGAGPLRLAKAAAVGTRAAITGGEGLAGAINAAGQTAIKPGLLDATRAGLANKGAQMEARAGGFGIGEKAAGQQPLGFYDSAKIASNLKSEGIKAGSPEARLKQVEDALKTRGQQIDLHLQNNNLVLGDAQKQAIADKFMQAIEKQPGVDDLTRQKAQGLADNFLKQSSDLKSLVNFRRGLDKQVINFNQNPSTALVAKQLAARTLRDTLSESTNKFAPGLKGLNRSYSNLINASEFLKGGSKAISDQSQGQGGGGLLSRALTNDTAQSVKSKTGAALQNLAPGEANPFSVGSIAGRTAPAGLLGAAASSAPQAGQPVSADPTATGGFNTVADPLAAGLPDVGQSAPAGSPYTQADLLNDIQRDPQNAEKYVSYYQSLDKVFNPSQTSMIKPTGQEYGLATGGTNALNQLAQLLQSNPSLAAKNATPGQGIPLVGSAITNAVGAGDYHALADNVLQSLIHLQTGATATPEEVKAAKGQLPQPGDSSEVVQRKLANLASMFAPYLNGNAGTSSSSPDLASALAGLGYSQ